MLEPLLTEHRLYDHRPFRLLADKAYSHPSTRRLLRALKIPHTIPERTDQINRRQAKGSLGGRPPVMDDATR
jgi:putative transposase